MSKKDEVIDQQNAATTIEAGKPITIGADTRKDATEKLNALRKQAEADGLTQTDGGFIMFNTAGDGKFSAVITFNKL